MSGELETIPVGNLPEPPPPAYSVLPEELKPEADSPVALAESNTDKETNQASIFATEAVKQGEPSENRHSWGSLRISMKYPMGTLHHDVWYKPPKSTKVTQPQWNDISSSIRVIRDDAAEGNGDIHYQKLADSSLTGYAFDIIVKDYATESASLAGTMTVDNVVYDWTGEFVAFADVTTEITVVSLERPADAEGTLQELKMLSPFAFKTEGDVKTAQDAAQIYGDQLMNEIMMHALKQRTREVFMPNLAPLTEVGQKILDDNRDYFHRAAVHVLAEELKKAPKIKDQDWAKHIKYKYRTLTRMMATPKAPSTGKDPVVEYGWDRMSNKEEIAKLQKQYQDVAMRCYHEGMKQHCPQWMKFLKTPEYWFKMYSAMLLSKEYKTRWLVTILDREQKKGDLSVTDEILMWGNKLSLLKSAAPPDMAAKLNVDEVTEVLLGEAQTKLAYAQVVNDEMVREINLLLSKLNTDPSAVAIREHFEKRQHYDKEIHAGIMADMSILLSELANPESGLYARVSEHFEKGLPPSSTRSRGLTFDQFIQAVENEKIAREVEMEADAAGLSIRKSWGTRIKGGLTKGFKLFFQGALHVLAIGAAMTALVKGGNELNAIEIVQISLSLAAESLNIAGLAVRTLIKWAFARFRGWTRTIAWFFNLSVEGLQSLGRRIVGALLGSLSKVVRLIGLIGCIFSVVSSYWDIRKALDMDDRDGKGLLIYSSIQFALGVIEGVLIVGEIIADIMVVSSGILTWCGPLAIVVGLAMLLGAAIYYFFFAPDPYKDVKEFLDNEGKEYDSYDPNAEVELEPDPPKPT